MSDRVANTRARQSWEYKSFVTHRIGEIHEKSNHDQWPCEAIDLNPADLGNRRMPSRELTESTICWKGRNLVRCPDIVDVDKVIQRPVTRISSLEFDDTD